jgi:hypothetical protein
LEALVVVLLFAAVAGYVAWGRRLGRRTMQAKLEAFRQVEGRHVRIGILGPGGHGRRVDDWSCKVLDIIEDASPSSVRVRLDDGTERYAPLADVRWLRPSFSEPEIRW